MGNVVFNMTMSLDGFVADLNDGPENGPGDGEEAPGVTHPGFRVLKERLS